MGRGFLSGIFWGGILSVALLFIATQALDRREMGLPQPTAGEVDVPGGSEFDQARPERAAVLPQPDARPDGNRVTTVTAPDQPTDAPPTIAETEEVEPVPEPSQQAIDTLGDAPRELAGTEQTATADSEIETAAAEPLETPVAPGSSPVTETAEPEALASAPDSEESSVTLSDDISEVETNTTAETLPETEESLQPTVGDETPQVQTQFSAPSVPASPSLDGTVSLPGAEETDAASLYTAPVSPGQPEISSEPSLPVSASNDTPTTPQVTSETTDAAVAQALNEAADTAESQTVETTETELANTQTERVDPQPATPSETAGADTNQAGTAGAGADETGIAAAEPDETEIAGTDTDGTQIAAAAPETSNSGSLPVVRRLGGTTDETVEADEEADTADLSDAADAPGDVTAEEADPEPADQPALRAWATEFANPDALPLLSIVLEHQDTVEVDQRILDALPPTVGFAIDAGRADAAELARTYRAAGREVVLIPSLPEGATPQDVEQSLAANFDIVPEAVALIDVSGEAFQSDRDIVAQVVDVVTTSGHGLITFPRGLNTAHQQAERAGIPTGLIFRNIDTGEASQEQIRRSLDRAAFRARQDEAVILVGSTQPKTLAALVQWASGNRGTSVALAPISAALSQ